jgi:hypothetical protein
MDEIVDDALGRGWMTDVKDAWNALSAAAKRLVGDGEVESMGRARYRYRIDKLPPSGDEPPTSATADDAATTASQGDLLAGKGGVA